VNLVAAGFDAGTHSAEFTEQDLGSPPAPGELFARSDISSDIVAPPSHAKSRFVFNHFQKQGDFTIELVNANRAARAGPRPYRPRATPPPSPRLTSKRRSRDTAESALTGAPPTRGIDTTIKDYRWNSTAQGWALHAAKDQKMAQWLEDAERQRELKR
jgi:hypothetical protein